MGSGTKWGVKQTVEWDKLGCVINWRLNQNAELNKVGSWTNFGVQQTGVGEGQTGKWVKLFNETNWGAEQTVGKQTLAFKNASLNKIYSHYLYFLEQICHGLLSDISMGQNIGQGSLIAEATHKLMLMRSRCKNA